MKSLHLSNFLMIQFYCKLRAHFYLSFVGEGEKKIGAASESEVVTEDTAIVYSHCITDCREMFIIHYFEYSRILRRIIGKVCDVDP